jgi:ATP-dependent helicase HrpB
VRARVTELGVESGEDLAMLSPQDLLAPDLDPAARAQIDRKWPRRIDLADARYTVSYQLDTRTVVVEQVAGGRKEPPPLSWLPAFAGFAIDFKHRNVQRTLRPRR